MKYFVLLLTRVKLIVNIEWGMIFKFADSISVGMELQTISPKLSLINPDLLKQSHSNTLYSSLANKCSLKVVLACLAILSICKSKASGRRSMVIGNFGLGLDLQKVSHHISQVSKFSSHNDLFIYIIKIRWYECELCYKFTPKHIWWRCLYDLFLLVIYQLLTILYGCKEPVMWP